MLKLVLIESIRCASKFVCSLKIMFKNNLLLVHENKQELIAIADYLSAEGFQITKAENGNGLNKKLESQKPDIILLPVEMNASNGIDLCHTIKSGSKTADIFIILLSNKKEEFTQVAGLESGADDFLFQPIHERVLLGRVKALLKRKKFGNIDFTETPLVIDNDRYLIIKEGVEYYLPKKEFEILSLLHSKPNKVFSRDEIKNAIWENFEKVRGRTVDVHIRKIREKIGDNLIATIKGVGYRLDIAS